MFKIPQETKNMILELFKQNLPMKEIAETTCVSVATANDVVKFHYNVNTLAKARTIAYLESEEIKL